LNNSTISTANYQCFEKIEGYLHPDYATSLSEYGNPRALPLCGGRVLERQIPDSLDHDAMGCYPLFVCNNWSKLFEDLTGIGNELVSLTLVTDPFGTYDLDCLNDCFDVVRPFKEHFVADLSLPITTLVSKSHQSTVRRATRNVELEVCLNPLLHLGKWTELFAHLS
jgi:hypothetical protein